jgi:hypothetical protein
MIRPSLRSFTVPAWDVCSAGISFLHDDPLEIGSVLALRLATGPRGVSYIRSARVVHVTEVDGALRVGCVVSPPFSTAELEGLR